MHTKRPKETVIVELRPIDDEKHLPVRLEQENADAPVPSFWGRYGALIMMVVLPTFLSGMYAMFFETDLYKSESQFIIRVISSNSSGGALGLLSAGNSNISRSDEDAYAVAAYLTSRNIVNQLSSELKTYFGRGVVDRLHRYPPLLGKPTLEELFEKYKRHVSVSMDGNGINTLDVYAYSPQDALDLNTQLLKSSETLVNSLNMRAEEDALRAAHSMVDEAQSELEAAQAALLEFRNRELIIDPQRQGLADLEIISQLASRQAQEQANLAQLVVVSPKSPQIQQQKERINALQKEIEQQKAKIVGGKQSLVPKLAEFERISLRRELSVSSLTSAVASFEAAKHDARMQRFFLETIVLPTASDRAQYPLRVLMVFGVFVASLIIFWITRKTLQLIVEHQA